MTCAARVTETPKAEGAAEHSIPTREVILDTAERLFSARGIEGVAVRDLARETGLTPSSLYNHFPSKRALYEAVLERGLRPIVEMVAAAWRPGTFRVDPMRATVDGLVTHLAAHPHLGRLLQRVLLEDGEKLRALVGRWVSPLYVKGMAVIRTAADDAGWDVEELPHLALGLFGITFGYFTNAAALQALGVWTDDPMSSRALTAQRRFLEEAIYRLLGPRQNRVSPKRRGAA